MPYLNFDSILGTTVYKVLKADHHIKIETVNIISERKDIIKNILLNKGNYCNNLIFFFMLMLWLKPDLKEIQNLPNSKFISAVRNDFSLNFDCHKFYEGYSKIIKDYISYTKYMKSISIRDNELNDDSMKDFCSALPSMTYLIRIDLTSIKNNYIPNN